MTDRPSALEGTWQMIRAELNGEPAPELVTSQTVLELKAGTYTVRYAEQVMDSGTYELGTEADARTMVLRGTSGPNAGRTIPCLYRLAGDRLRVCYGLDGRLPVEPCQPDRIQHYSASYQRYTTTF